MSLGAEISISAFSVVQADLPVCRRSVPQKRLTLIKEALHLLLAAADVELRLHNGVQLLPRHAESRVARKAV